MRIQVRGKGERSCPYCRDVFGAQESAIPCLRCGVMIHEECAEELSLCPLMGCGGRFRQARPARRGRRSAPAAPGAARSGWLIAGCVAFAVGLIGFGVASKKDRGKRRIRTQRPAARRVVTEILDPRQGPVDLKSLATYSRGGGVDIRIPYQPRRRQRLQVRAGDVFEGRAKRGMRWTPCHLIAGEDATIQSGSSARRVRSVFLEAKFVTPPERVILERVRRVDPSSADEVIASKMLRRFATLPRLPWRVRLVAYRMRLYDFERSQLLAHLPYEERERVLQSATKLLQRFSFLQGLNPKALRGFDMLGEARDFLPPRLTRLEPHESFRPLRGARNARLVEEIAHGYAKLEGLSPSQTLSLLELHGTRGNPRQWSLSQVLEKLSQSTTLVERQLWIEHVRALDPLLARGLLAAHAEDGLFGTPGKVGAAERKLRSWKSLVGDAYLDERVDGQGTRRGAVAAEPRARARLLANLRQDARLGRQGRLLQYAAHAPRDPELPRLCAEVAKRDSAGAREAALANVWRERAAEVGALQPFTIQQEDLGAVTLEVAFALDAPRRESFWHALLKVPAAREPLLTVFRRLAAHERVATGDVAAWCVLVGDERDLRRELVRDVGGVEALWSLTSEATAIDLRGWKALVRVLYYASDNSTHTTERLLRLVHAEAARASVIEVYAERYPNAATSLAVELSPRESVTWRLLALRLAIKHSRGEERQTQIRRGLRDRSRAVRSAASEGLGHFALQPSFLVQLCKEPDLVVAEAAWLQLAKSDARRASELGRTWARSRAPARTQLAFTVARKLLTSRPTLSKQVLQALAEGSRDPAIRRQAAALLR